MQTVEKMAEEYARRMDDDSINQRIYLTKSYQAFLAGHASRDSEVKALRDIVQKFVTQQDDMIQLARLMDDEYIPLDYYHDAKQLLHKYSKTGKDGE